MRLFCAIDTDPAFHPGLARLIDKLRLSGTDAKWTTPAQWHVTLKFLGEVGTEMIPRIVDTLARVTAATDPSPLRLDGIGVFGGFIPRVVFARVEDPSGHLEILAGALDRALTPLGFHPENRVFNPHVTLARLKSRRSAPELLEATRRESGSVRGEWNVGEVVLYQSTLKPSGAEYNVIARAPLGASVAKDAPFAAVLAGPSGAGRK